MSSSKQCPWQLPEESGATPATSDGLATRLFQLSEGSKYALICVDTASGLTQAFPLPRDPGRHPRMIREAECHELTPSSNSDRGTRVKGWDVRD